MSLLLTRGLGGRRRSRRPTLDSTWNKIWTLRWFRKLTKRRKTM